MTALSVMAVVSLPACRLDRVHAVMNHSGIRAGSLARASRKREMKSRELYWADTDDFSSDEALVRSFARARANVISGKVFVGDRRLTIGFLAQNFSIHGMLPACFYCVRFPDHVLISEIRPMFRKCPGPGRGCEAKKVITYP